MRSPYHVQKDYLKKFTATQTAEKVDNALVKHLYLQAHLAIGASLFCATIVLIGLYNLTNVFVWFGCYLMIAALRVGLILFYRKSNQKEFTPKFWRTLYIGGAILGGATWGLGALLLLPYGTAPQQALLILMLAGVTGGALPLSSAIPGASICFLVTSIVPYIGSILFLENKIYLLFDMALTLYLFYSIAVSIKGYHLIKSSIELRFENDNLLRNLSQAKEELEITNIKLEHAATHDALTQLANRSLFHTNLEHAISRAHQNRKRLALFYIDLDHFKLVNDVYGHHVGDRLLITITNKLSDFFKTNTIIARLGGDEITVILENLDNVQDVTQIADKICRLVAQPITIDKIILKMSASIGISLYPDDGDTPEALLMRADKAMYYVKEHGGNYFCLNREFNETEIV